MNSNETMRNLTFEHMVKLNNAYRELLAEHGKIFNNFDIEFYEVPMKQIMDQYIAAGGKAKDMIEPVDGFHPSQIAGEYVLDWIWEKL
jgi:acyloxyacyl hydrolase